MAVTTKVILTIDGMHCDACVRRVKQTLTRTGAGPVAGVTIGRAEIEAAQESLPALLAALEKAGFAAHVQH